MSIQLRTASRAFLVFAALLLQSTSWAAVLPTGLVCERMAEPLGIDVQALRFSWRLESQQRSQMQTARRILVASSVVQLGDRRADVWDMRASDSMTVMEGSISASSAIGVPHLRKEPGYAVYSVGLGTYQLRSQFTPPDPQSEQCDCDRTGRILLKGAI